MAKWDHDDLVSKHSDIISKYYETWKESSMPKPKTTKKRPPFVPIPVVPDEDPRYDDDHLEGMLESRMGWDLKDHPFKDVMVRRVGENAGVIVITDNDIVIIKDELNLFPSDAVVTQLRLLGGK